MAGSLIAAGVVVLRGQPGDAQVLVVHRPLRRDWTLPKGKPHAGETLPETAQREFEEETGYRLSGLSLPLGTTKYRVDGVPKRVHWWLGRLADDPVTAPAAGEVDRVRWCPVADLRRRLTYTDELPVVERALAASASVPLLIVRHAKALGRKGWGMRPDAARRLAAHGQRQAQALMGLLTAYGVTEVASSSSVRCLDTVSPYAARYGLPVEPIPVLSEEGALDHPNRVGPTMDGLRDRVVASGTALAVCGHRPVLPAMVERLGIEYGDTMKPAEVLVAHLDATTGVVLATERFRPRG